MITLTLHFETDKDRQILSEIVKHKDEESFIKNVLYKALVEETNKVYEITEDTLNQIDNLWNNALNM